MDLARDAFTVRYDPHRIDVDSIMNRIRSLGFDPEPAGDEPGPARATAHRPEGMPAPVRMAVARARRSNRLTLIDFYATWCAPCRDLDGTVLVDPRVRQALRGYELVKLDTDRHVEPSEYFDVVGLPTLLVLDGGGNELFRREGMIGAAELARVLNELAASGGR